MHIQIPDIFVYIYIYIYISHDIVSRNIGKRDIIYGRAPQPPSPYVYTSGDSKTHNNPQRATCAASRAAGDPQKRPRSGRRAAGEI